MHLIAYHQPFDFVPLFSCACRNHLKDESPEEMNRTPHVNRLASDAIYIAKPQHAAEVKEQAKQSKPFAIQEAAICSTIAGYQMFAKGKSFWHYNRAG
jgi:hypothetical protein